MDSWNNAPYSSDPSANRQPRYSNVSAAAISQPHDFNPPQQPQQPQHLPQQGSGYQAYHSSTTLVGSSSAVATPSTSRADSTNDYMDIDPENYTRPIYTQPQDRGRQPYLQSEDPPISQRYSPLNSSLSPQTQYTTASSTLSPMPSNYQARQSPSRSNFTTNIPQSYYNQSSGSPRTSAPAAIQSYNHPLQQPALSQPSPNISRQSSMNNAQLPPINIQNPVEGNSPRFYPSSATLQQPSFEQGQQPSPRANQQLTAHMEPAPQFTRVSGVSELQPRVHAQPAFRRANPDDGGFISVRCNFSHYVCNNAHITNSPYKP